MGAETQNSASSESSKLQPSLADVTEGHFSKLSDRAKDHLHELSTDDKGKLVLAYDKKLNKHLADCRILSSSSNEILARMGNDSSQYLIKEIAYQHRQFERNALKKSEPERSMSFQEQAKDFNEFIQSKLELFESAVKQVEKEKKEEVKEKEKEDKRGQQQEREAYVVKTEVAPQLESDEMPGMVEEVDSMPESLITVNRLLAVFTSTKETLSSALKRQEKALEQANLDSKRVLEQYQHERTYIGGLYRENITTDETLQSALNRVSQAQETIKDTEKKLTTASNDFQKELQNALEGEMKRENDPQKIASSIATWSADFTPDMRKLVMTSLVLSLQKEQFKSIEQLPQFQLLRYLEPLKAYYSRLPDAENNMAQLASLEDGLGVDATQFSQLFESSTLSNDFANSLSKLMTDTLGENFQNMTSEQLSDSFSQFARKIGEKIDKLDKMEAEKNPDPFTRLQLIEDLMEGSPTGNNAAVQAYHQEIRRLLESGKAADIPAAREIIKDTSYDKLFRASRAWEIAILEKNIDIKRRQGRLANEDLHIDALIGVKDAKGWDGKPVDIQKGVTTTKLLLRTAQTLRERGDAQSVDRARELLIRVSEGMVSEARALYEKSTGERPNLEKVYQETFSEAKIKAYRELGTPERRNAILTALSKDPNSTGKNLDAIAEQSILMSAEVVAEKTATAATNRIFLEWAFSETAILSYSWSDPQDDLGKMRLEALRNLKDSYGVGAFDISDENYATARYIGEEAVINAALIMVSGGVANAARAGAMAAIRAGMGTGAKELGKMGIRELAKKGVVSTTKELGVRAVGFGVESVMFHEVNTLLHAGMKGEVREWANQSWDQRFDGWTRSAVMLGMVKGAGAAFQGSIGKLITNKTLYKAGAFATEAVAFQASALDPAVFTDQKAWIDTVSAIVGLRLGGAIPGYKGLSMIGEIGAAHETVGKKPSEVRERTNDRARNQLREGIEKRNNEKFSKGQAELDRAIERAEANAKAEKEALDVFDRIEGQGVSEPARAEALEYFKAESQKIVEREAYEALDKSKSPVVERSGGEKTSSQENPWNRLKVGSNLTSDLVSKMSEAASRERTNAESPKTEQAKETAPIQERASEPAAPKNNEQSAKAEPAPEAKAPERVSESPKLEKAPPKEAPKPEGPGIAERARNFLQALGAEGSQALAEVRSSLGEMITEMGGSAREKLGSTSEAAYQRAKAALESTMTILSGLQSGSVQLSQGTLTLAREGLGRVGEYFKTLSPTSKLAEMWNALQAKIGPMLVQLVPVNRALELQVKRQEAVARIFDQNVPVSDKIGSRFSNGNGTMRVVGFENGKVEVFYTMEGYERVKKSIVTGKKEGTLLTKEQFVDQLQNYTNIETAKVGKVGSTAEPKVQSESGPKTPKIAMTRELQERQFRYKGVLEGKIAEGFISGGSGREGLLKVKRGTPLEAAKKQLEEAYVRMAFDALKPELQTPKSKLALEVNAKKIMSKIHLERTAGDRDIYSKWESILITRETPTQLMDLLNKRGIQLPDPLPQNPTLDQVSKVALQLSKAVRELCKNPQGNDAAVKRSEKLSGQLSLVAVVKAGAAVNRHQSLIYHILGVQLGLQVRTLKGWVGKNARVWNEVILPEGKKLAIDNSTSTLGSIMPEYKDNSGVKADYDLGLQKKVLTKKS